MFKTSQEEHKCIQRMIKLEEELGTFPPNGFGGGAGVGERKNKKEMFVAITVWENEGGSCEN